MTRRTALLLVPRALMGTTHKEMAQVWNSFNSFAVQWAKEVNETPVGAISIKAITLARQMDDLYKTFQKKRRGWEEGI